MWDRITRLRPIPECTTMTSVVIGSCAVRTVRKYTSGRTAIASYHAACGRPPASVTTALSADDMLSDHAPRSSVTSIWVPARASVGGSRWVSMPAAKSSMAFQPSGDTFPDWAAASLSTDMRCSFDKS